LPGFHRNPLSSILPLAPVAVAAQSLPESQEPAASVPTRPLPAVYGPLYCQHQFEQYKLAVEMADRISARRMQTNTFFLGINTALFSILASFLKDHQIIATTAIPLVIALLLLCGFWWWIVRYYRQLNSAKFEVILAMEASLPLAPYTDEWQALGGGKDLRRYLPLSRVENMVPLLFGLLYAALSLVMFLAGQPATAHHAG
jgi:hypothetical protein